MDFYSARALSSPPYRRGHVTPGLDGLTWGYFGADWGGAGSLAQLLLGLTKSASR